MEIDLNKTPDEIFLASLEDGRDEEEVSRAVYVLCRDGSEDVFRLALAYLHSSVPKQRARALDLLGQLGAGKPLSERPHFDEYVSNTLAHLGDEDPLVVKSAAWALSHLKDERAVTALIGMRHCADPGVRWAVAMGLAGSERPDAIRTLIELMEDEDDAVRNWATFGLGMAWIDGGSAGFISMDSTEIREALRKRLSDSFDEVRDEALWGLARRKDPAALRALLERLECEAGLDEDEEVAAEIIGRKYDASIEELRSGLRNLLAGK